MSQYTILQLENTRHDIELTYNYGKLEKITRDMCIEALEQMTRRN